MPQPAVELEITHHVAQIILNNPKKSNVLDRETSEQLTRCVASAEAHPDVSCILVSSKGKAFCAGGSLDELLEAQSGESHMLTDIYAGFLALARSPLPTIVVVQGAAVGAGFNLVLACDVVLVTPQAWFDTRFMKLGIHCGGGHTWLLQRQLNWGDSVAALLLGQTISAEQAVEKGLALECVPADAIMERAKQLAKSLEGVPPELVRRSKQSLIESRTEPSHENSVSAELEQQAWSLQQEYAKEKLLGFKRKISKA